MDLNKSIKTATEYCKKHNISNRALLRYIFDALTRYELSSRDILESTSLIDILRAFHKEEKCKNRYNDIIKELDIIIDENCKLLLKKCIYIEFISQDKYS